MCASSKNGEMGLCRPDLDSQIFNTKIATQTCTIRRGVWNLPHKFQLYLIVILMNHPIALIILEQITSLTSYFNGLQCEFRGLSRLKN